MNKLEKVDKGYHGDKGDLNVTFAQGFETPFSTAFIEACQQTGIPANKDYNGEKQVGTSFFSIQY